MPKYKVILSFDTLEIEFDTDEFADDFAAPGEADIDDPDPDDKLNPTDHGTVQDFIQEYINDNTLADITEDSPTVWNVKIKK